MICVWNYDTKSVIMRASTPLTHGIKHIAFSPDGLLLAASAMDEKHSLVVYNWESPEIDFKPHRPLATGFGPGEAILSIGFDLDNTTLIVTCVKAVWFFTFANGVMKGTRGLGWKNCHLRPETTLCHCFHGESLFTGFFSGHIGRWTGQTLKKAVKAHTGKVNSLYSNFLSGSGANKIVSGANKIVSGGNDGKVITWNVHHDGNLKQAQVFDLAATAIRSMWPKAISVCRKIEGGNAVIVGTRGGEIVEFNEKTGASIVH
jgi:WD40 repeat protein